MLCRPEDAKDGRPERNIKLTLRDGRHNEQWWRMKKDGQVFWADVTLTAIFDDDGRLVGISKVVRDLTEKKRADEELRRAKEAAEEASRLKSAFLANMSHEIRTPLGAILGFTDLLKDPLLSSEDRTSYVNIIDRNGRSLIRLIDDILDLSKVESGKLTVERMEIRIRQLIAEVSGLFEVRARQKGIGFLASTLNEVPESIRTDPTRLRQILNNIIGNAIKFTETGKVEVVLGYRKDAKPFPQLEINIKDTGAGIPADRIQGLFEPFSQADVSTTRQFGGTGLGLALSRKLARQLGGELELKECPEGVGCHFTVTVANHVEEHGLGKADPGNQIDPKPVQLNGKLTGTGNQGRSRELDGMNVLLAEDSADNQFLIKTLLTRAGAKVTIAKDGMEAVQLAQADGFDVVLMDVQMPVLDGIDATKKLRESGYETPIVALTAHAMKEERDRTKEAGCNAHLTKPLQTEKLIATLKSLVRSPEHA